MDMTHGGARRGWTRIATVGATLALALGLSACGAASGGVTAAKPTGGTHPKAAGGTHVTAPPVPKAYADHLTYGPIGWPAGVGTPTPHVQGYVLTTTAQLKEIPKAVAKAVRTALRTEANYVDTAWLGGMTAGAGTAKKVPPEPPAHVLAGRWVITDLVTGDAPAYPGPGPGCKNMTAAQFKTPLGLYFDYDMRDFLCNGPQPSNGDGYYDNPWNVTTFTHVTTFSGLSTGHPMLPVIVVAATADTASKIFVPFGARGDFRRVPSSGPGHKTGPTRYGSVEVEGWSALVVTQTVSARGWKIQTPLAWLWPATPHRPVSHGIALGIGHWWYYQAGCKTAPKAAPRDPATLPWVFKTATIVARKLAFCGPGQKLQKLG